MSEESQPPALHSSLAHHSSLRTVMQRHFDRDIDELKDLILRMGAMVEDAMSRSIRALLERDTELAADVIAHDDEIDRMEVTIDEKTIELIAKMQPAATDLRFVAAVMKITPEL